MAKRILVISDNHNNKEIVTKIMSHEKYDIAIHLGDSELGKQWAQSLFDYYVNGNNDFDFRQEEVFFKYEGLRFGIIHGHTAGITTFNYKAKALKFLKRKKLDVLLYGHTHIPYIDSTDDYFMLCPGSPQLPRSSEGPTYAILEIDNKKVSGIIKSINVLK